MISLNGDADAAAADATDLRGGTKHFDIDIFSIEQAGAGDLTADMDILTLDIGHTKGAGDTDAVPLDISATSHTSRDLHIFRGGTISVDPRTAADADILCGYILIKMCAAGNLNVLLRFQVTLAMCRARAVKALTANKTIQFS